MGLTPYTAFAYTGVHAPGLTRTYPQVFWRPDIPVATAISGLLALPPGARSLLLFTDSDAAISATYGYPDGSDNFANGTGNRGVWTANATATLLSNYTTFFAQLKAAGCGVDFVPLDVEASFGVFAINYGIGPGLDPDRLPAIAADSRAGAIATAIGIPANQWTARLYRPTTEPATNLADDEAWDDYQATVINAGLNAGIGVPLLANYPQALYCEFNSFKFPQSLVQVTGDGYFFYRDSNVGNVQNPVLYGGFGAIAYLTSIGGVPTRFDPIQTPQPPLSSTDLFYRSIITLNPLRAAAASAAGQPVIPELQAKSVQQDSEFGYAFSGTPWWDEIAYHAVIGGSSNISWFNPVASAADDQLIDDILGECAAQAAGSPPATCLTTGQIPYSTTDYFYTAMQLASGKVLGRVTFGTATSATITVAGQMYTVNKGASQGAWFGNVVSQKQYVVINETTSTAVVPHVIQVGN